jgi:hypothetical protein
MDLFNHQIHHIFPEEIISGTSTQAGRAGYLLWAMASPSTQLKLLASK